MVPFTMFHTTQAVNHFGGLRAKSPCLPQYAWAKRTLTSRLRLGRLEGNRKIAPKVGAFRWERAALSPRSSDITNMSSADKKLLIAIPIYDGIMALDAIGPFDCIQLLPNVEVVFVSHKPGAYQTSLGYLSLNATASFDDVPSPDIIIVPGGSGSRLLLDDEQILAWIRKVHETTLYTTSVCTGSLLLAAAGLLKGVSAACHWAATATLEKYGAKLANERVVQEGKILTSAGVSSGIDMALFLISLIADEETAKAVQLHIEYDPQPPFDSGAISKATPEVIEVAKSFGARSRKYAEEHFNQREGGGKAI